LEPDLEVISGLDLLRPVRHQGVNNDLRLPVASFTRSTLEALWQRGITDDAIVFMEPSMAVLVGQNEAILA
jgi:hypothetical protein